MIPEKLFQAVIETMGSRPDVTQGRMFGSAVLKAKGKVFSMLVKGNLVVKLPQQRVAAIVASGDGQLFDPGHGRPSKEWVAIQPSDKWVALSEEARSFVAPS